MDESAVTLAVLGAAVVLFVSNTVPVPLVAVGVSLSLWATGVIDLEQTFAGFGDPTVVFIAAMFVVADSLEASGVTAWIGRRLLDRTASGTRSVVGSVMVVAGVLTAFITPNAAVATLIPTAVIIAIRTRLATSQVMMPLAFAAHGGALLALTGSPVNVLVAEAGSEYGGGDFAYFSFALVGVPLLGGVVALTMVFGPRLLPERNGTDLPANFSALATTLARDYRLDDCPEDLFTRDQGVVEVVVPPRSPLVGRRAFRGMVTASGELLVLAIARPGDDIGSRAVELRVGDSLVLRGSWDAIEREIDRDVIVVADPAAVRRQVVALGLGAKESLVVLAGLVVLLATGAVPPSVAALVAAGVLVVLRVTSLERAYRAVSWSTVLLVAGMIPLADAMQHTGAAARFADLLVARLDGAGPHVLLAGMFIVVAGLSQLMSNTATALVMIPIAVTVSAELGTSPRPMLMAVNIAAVAAVLTPVATPANMMVMEPGGYRFGDYWRLGLPIIAWFFVVAVGITPLVWAF
jgi:di/tricarboxylate transporter